MNSIITKEVMNEVWEIGHQRVKELEALIEKHPILTRTVRDLKKDYIICLNAISSRDFNLIESTRLIIEAKEKSLELQITELEEDNKRSKKAKEIKESENNEDGK